MSKNNHGSMSGKGYYIALILCAAAIGISGYLYYRNANNAETQVNDPGVSVGATDPEERDVQAVATQPQGTKPAQGGAATQDTAPKTLKTASPVSGQTVAVYAMDELTYNATTRDWRVHNGIDIAAEAGTDVCAAADGTVYNVYEDEKLGTTVVIRHDGGYTTQYSSLDAQVAVEPGETVKLGDTIGCVGQTALLESAIGDHVHFSVTRDDSPMDPAEFLNMG